LTPEQIKAVHEIEAAKWMRTGRTCAKLLALRMEWILKDVSFVWSRADDCDRGPHWREDDADQLDAPTM
jgi:hypothetical protein